MADRYAKKPVANRFQMKAVRPGRIVRKTTVSKRNVISLKAGRPMKALRPKRKAR